MIKGDMRFALLLWLGLMLSGGAGEITVATFNIRYDTPGDKGPRSWEQRKDSVISTIREMDPDILGLQEALWSQIKDLQPALRGYDWAGGGRDDGKLAGEFCAIVWKMSRFRRMKTGTFWLSDQPYTAGSMTWGNKVTRICTWVRLIDLKSGQAFYLYNTHWDHQHQGSRERSARMVAAQIDARRSKGDPVILLGDFNATEDNPAIGYLTGRRAKLAGGDAPEQWPTPLVDVFNRLHHDRKDRRTVHGWKGTKDGRVKIDHIFASPGITPRKCAIVYSQKEGIWPSDHFPVRAILALPLLSR